MLFSKPRAHSLFLATVATLALGLVCLDASAFLRAAPAAGGTEAPVPAGPQPSEQNQARRAIDGKALHDPANPEARRLQTIEEATRHLPYDANGFPDWMRALQEGKISPRSDLSGKASMEVLDLDIVMKNTREMPHVRFPHRSHTLWLACSNCHPAPFEARAGSTQIRMADIFRGQYCGQCHDRVAFITFFSCHRCHSVPQGGASR
ncbi:MAG: hypothetical protein JNM32_09970 [Dechloromonas sp.]|jgi:c(7)-type cytochrome triheme protein|nr:hypothetical protein [Dechloromonas sp.]